MQTGKHEYLPRAETHIASKPWEFFTDDQLVGKTWMVVLAMPVLAWLRERDRRLGLLPA
jgi:hypothetical protein